MCTVLTLDQEKLVGRTMDFPPRTPWRLTFLPAGYRWCPASKEQPIDDRYAILGGMRLVNNHYLIGDGINDRGLVCAELFFPVAASYEQAHSGKLTLTPQDFIHWVLASHATVREVIADLENISVVKERWFDGEQYPFHWLLMDSTGTYGIEPLAGQMVVFKNAVGAYTNTPDYPAQLEKLNHYLGNDSGAQFTAQTKAGLVDKNSQITGRNSSDRFILAAQARWGSKVSTVDGLRSFLQSVTIPKNDQHPHNYTHYQAIINQQTGEYRFYNQMTGKVTTDNINEHAQEKEIERFE
ncbi:linear amide C-N hydrolase [Limosilactobacillus sp. c9Ua_26_M]|uniref:Linear amide C-N hydrolase n=1 Tax=Limosilactobacillus urinaemulieris TaxID=2742600 RepID=A0ABR8ZKX8_9LACO|nr:linear amide C-N hydrolase [Limosilactobacillus urinaemulieris]MBD8085959.1 linear amide C-N hydrolase [Limosilactobacillus urinaemulieris]